MRNRTLPSAQARRTVYCFPRGSGGSLSDSIGQLSVLGTKAHDFIEVRRRLTTSLPSSIRSMSSMRNKHVWVCPIEARWGPSRTVELRVSDPRDLDPYVRSAADDPDRPWQPGVSADRASIAQVVQELAPSAEGDSTAFAGELLRRLQAKQ